MNHGRFYLVLLLALSGLYMPGHAAEPTKIRAKNFKEDELALCQTKPCHIVAIHPAGRDERNEVLRVVELRLGETRKDVEGDVAKCLDGHQQ